MYLNHLPSPVHSVSPVCHESTVSGVPCVSSGELISGCDTPGRRQTSRFPGRHVLQLGAWSQFGGLWSQDCSSPLPSGSDCGSPASLPLGREGSICSWFTFLWYSLNPLFCDHSRGHCAVLEPFTEMIFFFFFFPLNLSGDTTVWVAITH